MSTTQENQTEGATKSDTSTQSSNDAKSKDDDKASKESVEVNDILTSIGPQSGNTAMNTITKSREDKTPSTPFFNLRSALRPFLKSGGLSTESNFKHSENSAHEDFTPVNLGFGSGNHQLFEKQNHQISKEETRNIQKMSKISKKVSQNDNSPQNLNNSPQNLNSSPQNLENSPQYLNNSPRHLSNSPQIPNDVKNLKTSTFQTPSSPQKENQRKLASNEGNQETTSKFESTGETSNPRQSTGGNPPSNQRQPT